MEETFFSDQRGDDVVNWCNKLDALGDVIGFLAWSEGEGEECFKRCGEYLGLIISDYARAIQETAGEFSWEINEAFEGDNGSKIHSLKRAIERFKKQDHMYETLDLGTIDRFLKELTPIFMEAAELNRMLNGMREEVVTKINELQQERASVETGAKTKAPENDGQKPESESTVTQQEA